MAEILEAGVSGIKKMAIAADVAKEKASRIRAEGTMRNGLVLLMFSFLLAACDAFLAPPASLDEISNVIEALRAAGCTGLHDIEVETDEYEVEGVTCNDGKSYDMKLDAMNFAVISKTLDWF